VCVHTHTHTQNHDDSVAYRHQQFWTTLQPPQEVHAAPWRGMWDIQCPFYSVLENGSSNGTSQWMYALYAIEAAIATDMIQGHSALPYCERNISSTAIQQAIQNSPCFMLYLKHTRTCTPEVGYMKCQCDTKQYVTWTGLRTNNVADSGAMKEGCSLGEDLKRSIMWQPSAGFNITFLTNSAWLPCQCFSVINKKCRWKKPSRSVNIFLNDPVYII
jgi:hypothetical protein